MKPYYEESGITIYHSDCREVLPQLPRKWANLVIADPPFSVPVKYHDTEGVHPRSWGDLIVMEPFFEQVFTQIRDAISDAGQVYVCCDATTYPVFFKVAYSRWMRSQMIVWYKPTGRHGNGWRHSHELILHAATPHTAYSDAFNQDVIGIMPVRTLNREHPAEKPGALWDFLMEAVPDRGAVRLIDPFLGSGGTLLRAKQAGAKAIGIDCEERCCEIAANRLRQEVLTFV